MSDLSAHRIRKAGPKKGCKMKDGAIVVFKDYVGLVLLGIGISFPMHQFFGGIIFAIAGASFASKFWPERNERELWVVVCGAILAAIFVAELVHYLHPQFPVQMAMGAAGFFSRHLARITLRAAGLMESRTDRIVNGVLDRVIPPSDEKDGK